MMKFINKIIVIMMSIITLTFAGEKKVLVEIFSNSHCPLCPPAHSTIDSYLQTANSDKIEIIYYHMAFPYSSDALYQHNTSDAAAKNNFYGPHSSTPKAYFDGTLVSNSYSNWGSNLDGRVQQESSFDITLSGTYTEDSFTIFADVTQSSDVSANELTINFVVVEDVNYQGNNGISNHKNVMRKIISPQGESISPNINETLNLSSTIEKNQSWNTSNLKVMVFIQNKSSKEVFQSASISYSDLTLTDISDNPTLRNSFKLEQNYPNPFNPSTTISYTIPDAPISGENQVTFVQLNVYDILGKEVATLVKERQNPGNYRITFDASQLSAGFYYYQLSVGNSSTSTDQNFRETRKMIYLK